MNAVRGYVDSSIGQVHFRRSGEGGPAIVLLHETPLSSAVFEPTFPYFDEWAQVLAIDTPGYGMSDPPTRPGSIESYAGWLVEVLQEWGIGPYIIVGTHTGASLCVAIASQCPQIVKGIGLVGLPAYTDQVRKERQSTWAPPMVPASSGEHLIEAWLKYERIWPDSGLWDRHRAVVSLLSVMPRYEWAYQAAFDYDPVPALRELRCPVIALAAEGDPLRPITQELASDLGFPFELIEGIAGQIAARKPIEFVKIIRDFSEAIHK